MKATQEQLFAGYSDPRDPAKFYIPWTRNGAHHLATGELVAGHHDGHTFFDLHMHDMP